MRSGDASTSNRCGNCLWQIMNFGMRNNGFWEDPSYPVNILVCRVIICHRTFKEAMESLRHNRIYLGQSTGHSCNHRPLARCVKLRIAHAPGCRERFPRPPRVSDPDMHHVACVTHVPWCMPWSLTIGFHWNRWRGKRSGHSWRIRNQQFYVSGKRPMLTLVWWCDQYHFPMQEHHGEHFSPLRVREDRGGEWYQNRKWIHSV